MRGRRRMREDVDHPLAFADAATRSERIPENLLRLRVVERSPEDEPTALLRPGDGPAGEDPCQLGYILLRVTAVHAECVQLHQLAGVVFVQPALGRQRDSEGLGTGLDIIRLWPRSSLARACVAPFRIQFLLAGRRQVPAGFLAQQWIVRYLDRTALPATLPWP